MMAVAPAMAQTQPSRPPSQPAAASARQAKPYKTPKTAWGDPDLSGVYSNNDESGIPLERPNQFDGKTLEDISDSELAELRKERNDAAIERAPNLGVLPGSNPVHWFENFGAKNSRAWLVAAGRRSAGTSRPRRRQQLRQRPVQQLPRLQPL